ncbi:hypothetical protein AUP68_07269 [Ilyonectria robusta]
MAPCWLDNVESRVRKPESASTPSPPTPSPLPPSPSPSQPASELATRLPPASIDSEIRYRAVPGTPVLPCVVDQQVETKDHSHVGRNQSIKPHHAAFPARCGEKLAAAATVAVRETSCR